VHTVIIDFREMPVNTAIHADICIVGSGPAGLAVAREFLGTETSVIVLESGGLKYEPDTESLNAGESIGLTYRGFTEGRRRQFAGAANTWGAVCVELDPSDFEYRPWIPGSGWPITAADVAKFYPRARTMLGLSRTDYNSRDWRELGMEAPAFDAGALRFSIVGTTPITDLGKAYRDAIRESINVKVLTHANVTALGTNRDGSAIERVEFRSLDGRRGTIEARAVVLCCGGIENARLLLMSRDAHAQGLGNGYDLVGRYYVDHAISYTANIVPPAAKPLQPIFRSLRRWGSNLRPRLSLSRQSQERAGVLNCMAQVVFEHPADGGFHAAMNLRKAVRFRRRPATLGRDIVNVLRHPRELATMAIDRYARGLHPAAADSQPRLECRVEQLPNPQSRVTLSNRRDPLGSPLPVIDWRSDDLERRTMAHMTDCVGREFLRLGLGRVEPEAWLADARTTAWQSHLKEGFNHMGTTRMAASPRAGVVDEHGNVHGVAGLYVSGASIFPAAGFANAGLTIVAIAIRLADHLKARLNNTPEVALASRS
jgi:choline dehydrogenase-like flavoprotein